MYMDIAVPADVRRKAKHGLAGDSMSQR